MFRRTPRWVVVLVAVLLVCCVVGVVGLGVGGYLGYKLVKEQATFLIPERVPTAIPELWGALGPEDEAMLSAVVSADMPTRDLVDLGIRLKGLPVDIRDAPTPAPPVRREGDRETFWVSDQQNPDRVSYFQAEAELRVISDHANFWVEAGLKNAPTDQQLRAAGQAFDRIYETNHSYFGAEWSPGIDGEARVHVYNGRVPGVGGYFSGVDECSRSVAAHSNEKEMFYVNLENLTPGTDMYSAVLSHEFQHMIRWHQDRREDGWVNEGLSELAMTLNGYPTDGSQIVFAMFPDTQLDAWTNDPGRSPVHYGASYLFTGYFYDRFGSGALKNLGTQRDSGIAGFSEVLAGEGVTFDDLFRQWTVVNGLSDQGQRQLPYGSPEYAGRHTTMRVGVALSRYPASGSGTVHQYGTDYLRLNPPHSPQGNLTVQFKGSPRTRLLPTQASGGQSFWYSNRGDDRDMTLTRSFDLRQVRKATLTYSTWYDVEDGWDFGYVEVSTDGGRTWSILRGTSSSDKDPVAQSYGWGYTGVSGGGKGDAPRWLKERIDLAAYVGQQIALRFEYITDDAYNAVGWALDDIAIPELAYLDTVEDPQSDWQAAGFVRCSNFVPQRFSVQLMELTASDVRVRTMELDAQNRGTLQLGNLGGDVTSAVLVISAMTPLTTEWGYYEYQVSP